MIRLKDNMVKLAFKEIARDNDPESVVEEPA